jgi:hypothetical protein
MGNRVMTRLGYRCRWGFVLGFCGRVVGAVSAAVNGIDLTWMSE